MIFNHLLVNSYLCMMSNEKLVRINKYLTEAGVCSRRMADKWLEQGRITLNGKIPLVGEKVKPGDLVRVDGDIISNTALKRVYLALNKPKGIECTTNTKVKNNIIDFINYSERIFPIGRLDKMSEGLILLTNDGDIVNKILRAKYEHEKEYIVKVNKPINTDFTKQMGGGIPILDSITSPCKVEMLDKFTFKIILTQGLNRQIRRMCEYLGYKVSSLQRIRVLNIKLDMPIGKWRYLTKREFQLLEKQLEM